MLRGWEAWVCQFGQHTRVGFTRTCHVAVDGCMRVCGGNFFFPILSDTVQFSLIRSEMVQNRTQIGPIWAEILVKKKKNLKIRSKHTVLLADFKGKTLKSSQFSLLSIITLKLVYVYHYMKKKKCLAICRK